MFNYCADFVRNNQLFRHGFLNYAWGACFTNQRLRFFLVIMIIGLIFSHLTHISVK